MIPKVIFHRSHLYDAALKREPEFEKPPEEKAFAKKIKSYEALWKKEGPAILEELQRVTKLKWHNSEIVCYVTWGVYPYSDPLTINPRKDANGTLDILTHELIHVLLSQESNSKVYWKNWRVFLKKHTKYSYTTSVHIAVHAIHEHIFRKLYNVKRLTKEINDIQDLDYVLSWEIVQKEGYKNIIAEITKGL
jgi:hypothetical protein